MKILVATNNTHKIEELKALINIDNCELFSMKDLNISLDIEENGSTFAENASIKATTLYQHINSQEYKKTGNPFTDNRNFKSNQNQRDEVDFLLNAIENIKKELANLKD